MNKEDEGFIPKRYGRNRQPYSKYQDYMHSTTIKTQVNGADEEKQESINDDIVFRVFEYVIFQFEWKTGLKINNQRGVNATKKEL